MSYKPRFESDKIKIFRFLNPRMSLGDNDLKYYHNLVKGYEGEVMFDSMTERLQCQSYILNDLLLETSGSKFQLDSVILTQKPLYLFEIKNFEGDYYFEDGKFYSLNKKDKEIKNPLQQLERSESSLRQLLQNLGYKIPIEPYVVFINPEFNLYQAPLNKPIIYPNQINRFMKKLNVRPSNLNSFHQKLADQLVSLHQIDTNRDKIPPYNYVQLKKGNSCGICHSLKTIVADRKLVCGDCGHEELLDHAVLRSVGELRLLFPEVKVTTVLVFDWCGEIVSKKAIRRILLQNFNVIGKKEYKYINLK